MSEKKRRDVLFITTMVLRLLGTGGRLVIMALTASKGFLIGWGVEGVNIVTAMRTDTSVDYVNNTTASRQ
jgi:hypothetical protein